MSFQLFRIPLLFRKCSCHNQGIGDRNDAQNNDLEQAPFHGEIAVICKRAEGVDGSVDDDAREQASAAIKNRDKQEADRDCKDNLAQVVSQIHATAVEQVDDMPDAEGHA